MTLRDGSDAAALCAELAIRAPWWGGAPPGSIEGLTAWVRGWAATHDPDADGIGGVPGLPLAADVQSLLRGSALCREIRPLATEYDEVVVLGASSTGIWRRLTHLDRSAVRAPTLTLLAGRREHLRSSGGGRDGDLAALLGRGGPFPAATGWAPTDEIAKATAGVRSVRDPWAAAAALFPDETSLALLLLERRWPAAAADAPSPAMTRLADGRSVVGEIRERPGSMLVRRGVPGRFGTVRVLDAHSVPRRIGPPRPTTSSTLRDWLEHAAAQHEVPHACAGLGDRRILFLSGQPHLARVGRIVRDLGIAARCYATVEVAGPAAPDRVDAAVILRELVDLVDADRSRALSPV